LILQIREDEITHISFIIVCMVTAVQFLLCVFLEWKALW
jgi:hypothetical protein